MRQLKIAKQVTNRETASLDKYLQEIGRVDLITADEEVELARRIRTGDRAALERLTKANLRFVVSVSKQYQNQGLALPDLIKQSLAQNGRHISMDAPLVEGDESSSNMYDVLSGEGMPSPENNLTIESLRSDIKRSLLSLTPRESEVISMFYGLEGRPPMSLEEIGDRFDLTRERVRQIKEKAIRRLKHTSKNKILKSYLG